MYKLTIKNKVSYHNDLKDLADALIGHGASDGDIQVAINALSNMKFTKTLYSNECGYKVDVVKDIIGVWFRVDEYQFCKKDKAGLYHFVDILWLDRTKDEPDFNGLNDYVLKQGVVDLDCYSEYDKEYIVTSYYPNGLDEVRETYGDSADQIIAECIFEESVNGECNCSEFMTLEDAEKRLIEIVGKGFTMSVSIIYELLTYFDGNTYECIYGGEVSDILCGVGFDVEKAQSASDWCDDNYTVGDTYEGDGFEITIKKDY